MKKEQSHVEMVIVVINSREESTLSGIIHADQILLVFRSYELQWISGMEHALPVTFSEGITQFIIINVNYLIYSYINGMLYMDSHMYLIMLFLCLIAK